MDEVKKILIIGNSEEFLVRSVVTEMERRWYKCTVCPPKIDVVSEVGRGIKVYLLFVDSADGVRDLLIFLKDTAFDKKTEIGLVGEHLDLKEAVKLLTKEHTGRLFERPVDAKQISDGLEALEKEAEKKAERKRILIVDDDAEYLRRTQQILHNHYKVYMANSGATALKLLSKHSVDLILLDYVMPILDGPKVLEVLKSEPDTSNIPVIFLSGQTDARSVTKAMTMGSENYLSKQLAATELAANISDFFARMDWESSGKYGKS